MKRPHTLVVLVEDHPGVSEPGRVVVAAAVVQHRLDHGRAFRATRRLPDDAGCRRRRLEVEQAGKQLYKLLEVLKVTDTTDLPTISHEMCLVKVAAKAQHRQEILLIAQIYDARVVDASPSTLLLEIVGSQDKIDSLLAMVRPFGIRELVRTGAIAMTRGGALMSGKGISPVERSGEIAAD